jgi:beta-galactosidase
MTGAPCTILQEALGLQPIGERQSTHRYFLSVTAIDWLAPQSELRVGFAQTFAQGPHDLLRIYGAEEACGFDISVGAGRAIVLTADLPGDLVLFARLFSAIGVEPGLTHDHPLRGIFLTSASTPGNARFIHALNLDGIDKELRLFEHGEPLLEGRQVMLRRRDGLMLPMDLPVEGGQIRWASCELLDHDDQGLTFRRTGPHDAISIRTARNLQSQPEFRVTRRTDDVLIEFTSPSCGDDVVRIAWS